MAMIAYGSCYPMLVTICPLRVNGIVVTLISISSSRYHKYIFWLLLSLSYLLSRLLFLSHFLLFSLRRLSLHRVEIGMGVFYRSGCTMASFDDGINGFILKPIAVLLGIAIVFHKRFLL